MNITNTTLLETTMEYGKDEPLTNIVSYIVNQYEDDEQYVVEDLLYDSIDDTALQIAFHYMEQEGIYMNERQEKRLRAKLYEISEAASQDDIFQAVIDSYY